MRQLKAKDVPEVVSSQCLLNPGMDRPGCIPGAGSFALVGKFDLLRVVAAPGGLSTRRERESSRQSLTAPLRLMECQGSRTKGYSAMDAEHSTRTPGAVLRSRARGPVVLRSPGGTAVANHQADMSRRCILADAPDLKQVRAEMLVASKNDAGHHPELGPGRWRRHSLSAVLPGRRSCHAARF